MELLYHSHQIYFYLFHYIKVYIPVIISFTQGLATICMVLFPIEFRPIIGFGSFNILFSFVKISFNIDLTTSISLSYEILYEKSILLLF